MNKRFILTILLSLAIIFDGGSVVFANQKLIVVRKAYYKSTGKKWDEATPNEKKKFLREFSSGENRSARQEQAELRQEEREEAEDARERAREYRKLQRVKHTRERAKQLEKRDWLREKRTRERELAIAKKKLVKARQKFASQKRR